MKTFLLILIGILAVAANTYIWVKYVPQAAMELHYLYADKHPPDEGCNSPLPELTPEYYEERGWDQYEYEGDRAMPGPMLECEAGDHTCID